MDSFGILFCHLADFVLICQDHNLLYVTLSCISHAAEF